MKKVAFYTLGCKVNQYETEAMAELFEKSGYTVCDFDEFADIYVINTCTVTSMSDRKSRQIIRRAKKMNENAYIIVTGCYAQVAQDEVAKIEGVNLVLGAKDRDKIVTFADEYFKEQLIVKSSDISYTHTFEPLTIGEFKSRTRAYIKVQEGCNQFCSYCIIPYARGPIRSRDLDDVINETKRLANAGFTEVTYVGIHIASYGLDKKNYDLADLLCAADKVDGIKRIRLSSIEPMTLNADFIKKISGVKKLCHHFHLSLQSGCDETLKRMNRKYTVDDYYNIVLGLRRHFPDVAITTDIMVGFPGETEEEFSKTCAFLEKVSFSSAHIFQYSRRKGTPADSFENQIPSEIKAKRSKIVKEITDITRLEFMEKFIGCDAEVLFEQRVGGYFEGKTGNYMNVLVKTDAELSGQYKTVRLERIKNGSFIGKIVNNNYC
ncbi:MAG: tRNA (N(6)-L-threonylcarbamoyladenosine(37)-C(2))-methylthiotransferase MtaB [Clostridia bacterium]|nr:tRNA (N(6)-L-threonylcarbamoyladenosine(37)-C(2))-methylthiotransferase MtaB [Clostridia bacterium]